MADIEVKVKIDGIEYTQEQLADMAKGAKKAGEEVKDLGKETKKTGEETATIWGDVKKRFNDAKDGVLKVTRSFKGLKGAIAATGIGALLIAFASLIAYFKSSEEGSRKLAIATETLKVLFGKLVEVLSFIGEEIVSVFEDPLGSIKNLGQAIVDNIVERFNSLLDVIGYVASAFKNLFAGEFTKAWEDVKSAGSEMIDVFTGVDNSLEKIVETGTRVFNEIKSAVEDAVDAATRLVDMQRALRDQQQRLIVENAELNKQMETQQKIAEDTTRSYDERKAALEKVGEAQVQLAKNIAEQAKNEEALLKLQIQTANTYEEREELETQLAEATAARIDAETALETKVLDVAKITVELDQEELERKRSINDTIKGLELQNIEDKRERALTELQIAEDAAIAELDLLKATEEEKAKVRGEYIKLRQKVNEEADKGEIEASIATLNTIAGAFGEGTSAYKAFKIAETSISTYVAAQKAYESAQDLPFGLGVVIGPVAAAAAIASGLKTIEQIRKTQVPEAAYGGMIQGPSHSGGGSLIEAEGGEFIINKYAMRQPGVADIANSLNQSATPGGIGGGIPIKTYVVASDVTSAQEANSKIKNLSRL